MSTESDLPYYRSLITERDYLQCVRDVDPSFTDVKLTLVGPGHISLSVRPTTETMPESLGRLVEALVERRAINVRIDLVVPLP
jgi:hypothetical protein